MSCLLYCVFREEDRKGAEPQGLFSERTQLPPGVGGASVSLVNDQELCAAVSQLPRSASLPEHEKLLEYKKVVDFFHRDRTVVPMRYGELLEDFSSVKAFLYDRRVEHRALLDRMAGCVEMGIRILVEDADGRNRRPTVKPDEGGKPTRSGHAYLLGRKAFFREKELSQQASEGVLKQARAALYGLFTEFKAEMPAVGSRLLSLYFLVPRGLVDGFRERFRDCDLRRSHRTSLSGPWPAYNFVQGAVETGDTAKQVIPGNIGELLLQ